MTVVAVLLAGGRGTRLYPASRADRPKQFLAPGDGPSLLRRTADRAAAVADRLVAVTPERYADRVAETVPEADVLVEPVARDTGPALCLAAHHARETTAGPAVCLCLPTDHHMTGDVAATLEQATAVAADREALVALGVEPARPATGYGYLEPGATVADGRARRVRGFAEKPDADRAAGLVADGWWWNAGVYAWRPGVLLRAAAGEDGPLAALAEALAAGQVEAGYAAAPSVSIDEAVVEPAPAADAGPAVLAVPAAFEWDDVGSWDALGRVFGDALATDALRLDAPGTVVADDGVEVSVVGVEDVVVAAHDDRVLVVDRERAQRVREVVRRREAGETAPETGDEGDGRAEVETESESETTTEREPESDGGREEATDDRR